MYRFLVDVNLPKYFQYFNDMNFTHVVDIGPTMSDKEIWNYAIENEYVILTKDTDFYTHFVASSIAPKVIYFKIGNQTLKELHEFFKDNWSNILLLLDTSRFIIVTKLEIEIIN
jgi:predicted nuclease of predicted toxin-antitoxin system